jgi:hypothetical protein
MPYDIKDTLKEIKVIKLTPFYDRAKTASQSYSKLVEKEHKLQALTPEGEVMHKNITDSITWYIKLIKNFAKASTEKDRIKFDDLIAKYGSLVNLGHVPFNNPEKILSYIEPLEAARKKVGTIEVVVEEPDLSGVVVAAVEEAEAMPEVPEADLNAYDDLFGDEEEQGEEIDFTDQEIFESLPLSDDSLEREAMSSIFADDKEITGEATDPLSQIGKSGESLDAHIPVPVTREMRIEAVAKMPPMAVKRSVPRGTNPYRRP